MIGYTINIRHANSIISSYVVSMKDISEFRNHIGRDYSNRLDVSFVAWLYQHRFGLDILPYTLSESKHDEYSFTVFIRQEDLQNLRNNKLNNLGI